MIQAGTYMAQITQAAVQVTKENKLPMVVMSFLVEGESIVGRFVLARKDKSLNERTIEDIKAVTGWNGVDLGWFDTADMTGKEAELVIEMESWEGKPRPTIKWLNVPGQGNRGVVSDPDDIRNLMTEYGSRLRALAGPQPVAKPSPTAPKAPLKAPSAKPVAASSSDDCWTAFCAISPKLSDDNRSAQWFKLLESVSKADPAEFTSEDWGRVMAAIDALPPF